MKPIELTIYPFQTEQYPSGYRIERDGYITRHGAAHRAASKHLTDAELAAEYWQERDHVHCLFRNDPEESPNLITTIRRAAAMEHTLHRFATAPHYYEEQE